MNIKNIGVIGVGGVGGYFGGKLCRLLDDAAKFSVSFVARGDHLRAIQESGLFLRSEHSGDSVCKPTLVTDDFECLPPLDLCLVCVKEFDLAEAASRLPPLIADHTIVLPLLNGVDVYSRLRSIIKNGVVLPACVYVGTHIERPGQVTQKGGACKILFGPDPAGPDFTPDDVLTVFKRAAVDCQWTPNVDAEIWKKFIFICAFGLVSAAYDKTLGQILEDSDLRNDALSIMNEAIQLAMKSGVTLPADIVEASLNKGRSFPYEAKTSFQRDFERTDKPDERDLFAGAMMRMADRFGVEAPRTRAITAILEARKPSPAIGVR